jgi:hypothetical protein
MLDGDLMVQARRVQELLEVALWKTSLGRVALGARRLVLDCRNQVVAATTLVIFSSS